MPGLHYRQHRVDEPAMALDELRVHAGQAELPDVAAGRRVFLQPQGHPRRRHRVLAEFQEL